MLFLEGEHQCIRVDEDFDKKIITLVVYDRPFNIGVNGMLGAMEIASVTLNNYDFDCLLSKLDIMKRIREADK